MTFSAIAQDAFQTPAVLATNDGKTINAFILAATKTDIRYKTTAVSTTFTDAKRREFQTIFILPTARFSEAMDLYEGGKFSEAQEKFAAVKRFHAPTKLLENNYHTLGGFYEMECMRNLGNYDALAEALKKFSKAQLTRDHQLRQLELYQMYDEVRSENWDGLLKMASKWDGERLPGYQRAQVGFCKGLALHKTEQLEDAIVEYNVAIVADGGGSVQIAQKAAINILEIYQSMPDVQEAMKNWGTEAEEKKSEGYIRLQQAASLAGIYENSLKADMALPGNLKKFLEFKASE